MRFGFKKAIQTFFKNTLKLLLDLKAKWCFLHKIHYIEIVSHIYSQRELNFRSDQRILTFRDI